GPVQPLARLALIAQLPVRHGNEEAVEADVLVWLQLLGLLESRKGLVPIAGEVMRDAQRVGKVRVVRGTFHGHFGQFYGRAPVTQIRMGISGEAPRRVVNG